ncbi:MULTISPECIES: LDCC motif putative metal-binding protein [Caproicibacterium]|uniref:LDCC motif putative metal-binding protein n=1 Tax=Caproicibacterium argilliputei TaxID=3030016 RepID=A0AA97H1R8_9FIRM|nr:LDCC motif putative metal-binding protein [Caproicibacterium argilliputei]WOC32713.1 LDCC motif putative metal-binding protein [Caproicibacterium argilliputei]
MTNPFVNMKNAWKRWLNRMAKANQQAYGSGVPDCCKMNRQTSQQKKP